MIKAPKTPSKAMKLLIGVLYLSELVSCKIKISPISRLESPIENSQHAQQKEPSYGWSQVEVTSFISHCTEKIQRPLAQLSHSSKWASCSCLRKIVAQDMSFSQYRRNLDSMVSWLNSRVGQDTCSQGDEESWSSRQLAFASHHCQQELRARYQLTYTRAEETCMCLVKRLSLSMKFNRFYKNQESIFDLGRNRTSPSEGECSQMDSIAKSDQSSGLKFSMPKGFELGDHDQGFCMISEGENPRALFTSDQGSVKAHFLASDGKGILRITRSQSVIDFTSHGQTDQVTLGEGVAVGSQMILPFVRNRGEGGSEVWYSVISDKGVINQIATKEHFRYILQSPQVFRYDHDQLILIYGARTEADQQKLYYHVLSGSGLLAPSPPNEVGIPGLLQGYSSHMANSRLSIALTSMDSSQEFRSAWIANLYLGNQIKIDLKIMEEESSWNPLVSSSGNSLIYAFQSRIQIDDQRQRNRIFTSYSKDFSRNNGYSLDADFCDQCPRSLDENLSISRKCAEHLATDRIAECIKKCSNCNDYFEADPNEQKGWSTLNRLRDVDFELGNMRLFMNHNNEGLIAWREASSLGFFHLMVAFWSQENKIFSDPIRVLRTTNNVSEMSLNPIGSSTGAIVWREESNNPDERFKVVEVSWSLPERTLSRSRVLLRSSFPFDIYRPNLFEPSQRSYLLIDRLVGGSMDVILMERSE